MSSKSKRIYILGDDEIQHLYALPKLSLDEKDIFFTLNNAEMKVFEEMNAVATKIHFVLQYGYFKIKQRLFEYNYDSVKDDLEYINQRYALGAKLGQSILINARKRDNNKKILNLGGFSEFGIGNNQQVVQYAISLASRLINHATIFTELITYLNNQKIIVPPYTVMQDLITMVINIEERRLGNIINEHLPKQLEITLMEMLLSGKDLNLTSFKKIPKNFKYMAFRGELIKGENFKEAYYFAKKFLQKASISEYKATCLRRNSWCNKIVI